MSDNLELEFKTVIVDVEGGYSAGILFEDTLIQDATVCKTRKQARKRIGSLTAKFVKATEKASRDMGYMIDKIHTDK
jgi:hypothetical protein